MKLVGRGSKHLSALLALSLNEVSVQGQRGQLRISRGSGGFGPFF